jgi:hypothetical protein
METSQSSSKMSGGHSASVQMWLHVGGRSLVVVQAGDKALKLRDHTTLPSGPASLEIIVDGQSRRSAVMILENGEPGWIPISAGKSGSTTHSQGRIAF